MIVRVTWQRALLILAALVALAMGTAWSGVVPIAASSGHWKITDWFLHWTMQNSVRTYSTTQTPAQVRDDKGLVSAAGHFRQACQVCHGAPGVPPSPAMQAATPPAPDLARTAAHYSDRELFWIIQHGIKYTGMPAWPRDDRPDEVSRMVAFVRRLPQMSAMEYRSLTAGEEMPRGDATLSRCTGCHGRDGMGREEPGMPILAGQKMDYLLRSLRQHATGQGSSAIMHVAASDLSRDEMIRAAQYFAQLPGLEDRALPTGLSTLAQGHVDDQLPDCSSCHAPGKGAPVIAGQRAPYIASRLRHWRGDEAMIDAHKPQDPMAVIARRIPEDRIEAVARALAQR